MPAFDEFAYYVEAIWMFLADETDVQFININQYTKIAENFIYI